MLTGESLCEQTVEKGDLGPAILVKSLCRSSPLTFPTFPQTVLLCRMRLSVPPARTSFFSQNISSQLRSEWYKNSRQGLHFGQSSPAAPSVSFHGCARKFTFIFRYHMQLVAPLNLPKVEMLLCREDQAV